MKGFRSLTPVEDAVKILGEHVSHRVEEVEEVSLISALGRVCGEDVYSPMDSPTYDRSAVDGYALIAEDTFGASPMNPIRLKVIGRAETGVIPSSLPTVSRGEAVEVMTGAPIPRGANAVIQVEHVRREGEFIQIEDQTALLQNISRRGEDYRRGEIVLRKGWIIKPWHIGALASLGVERLKVLRRIRVALLSTGREVIELGNQLKPGQVYDSTKPMLMALLSSHGATPIDLGLAPDDLEIIAERISRGVEEADMVIVLGGTSVGEHDLVPEAVSRIGKIMVHGLAVRPGKPIGFAVSSGKPIFMLSGFPVAALVGFQALVVPAIEKILGCVFDPAPRVRGKLTRRISSPPGIRTYVRVKVFRDEGGEVMIEPLRVTGSGMLSTLTRGNGLLVIPEDLEGYDEGSEVEVMLLSPIFEGR